MMSLLSCFFVLSMVVWCDAQRLCSSKLPEDLNFMPALSNGFLGTIAGSGLVHVAGLYNGRSSKTPSHRADLPSGICVKIEDAQLIEACLDLDQATFQQTWSIGQANVTELSFAARNKPHILMSRFSSTHPFVLKSCANFSSVDVKLAPFTCGEGAECWSGSTLISETPTSNLTKVAVVMSTVPTSPITGTFWITQSTATAENPERVALDAFRAVEGNESDILSGHVKEWAKIWKTRLDSTNERLSEALKASQYQIFSAVREDVFFGLSPCGFTNGYNGHIFWDMDTWQIPSLLFLKPSLSYALLKYRFDRLGEALDKAKGLGFSGALYPWESAFTGIECCPQIDPEGIYEHHISGDIAFALMQFWHVTKNKTVLKENIYPVLKEIARFWASRYVVRDPKKGFEILQVMCPDESAGVVNNSIYTNIIAQYSVNYAISVAKLLNESIPQAWTTLSNIPPYLPYDEEKLIHLEHDGYVSQMINQDDVGLLQYPLDFQMSEAQKERDLLFYYNKTRKNGYFTGDSAYSISALALGLKDLANEILWNATFAHMKQPFFTWNEKNVGGELKSVRDFVLIQSLVSGHPHFLTGAGGFLQNVLFGYLGLSLGNEELILRPKILPYSDTLSAHMLSWRGILFTMKLKEVSETMDIKNDGECSFIVCQSSCDVLSPSETRVFQITTTMKIREI